ncbi:hypothetical protein ACIBLA_35575 [Streptomyces sp. NPDC050433]|uniref:hypothetical protein n=1 Tax=Streptomyces sp. NPDC050433 TaxID=3365615 RepID=UPI00379B8849
MPERDWDDDTEYRAALARAEKLTRFSWATMVTLLALTVVAPVILAGLTFLVIAVSMGQR